MTEIETSRSGVTVTTAKGPMIRARHVIFATGYEVPKFVPPPTPRTDQEYWQAEQYHFEHGLPAPLPPPRQEREEW